VYSQHVPCANVTRICSFNSLSSTLHGPGDVTTRCKTCQGMPAQLQMSRRGKGRRRGNSAILSVKEEVEDSLRVPKIRGTRRLFPAHNQLEASRKHSWTARCSASPKAYLPFDICRLIILLVSYYCTLCGPSTKSSVQLANAWISVIALPRMRVWMSYVPS